MRTGKMKSLTLTGLVASVLILGTACDKDNDEQQPASNTITDVVVANSNFSTLKSAVVKADLQETLKGAGPFTVFAPDDAAFAASGITSPALNSLTPAEVK